MTTPNKPHRAKIIPSVTGPGSVMPSGEAVHGALTDWMKHEVSHGSERTYDLGKFLFTVSMGTAGLLAALVTSAKRTDLLVLAIIFDALSAVSALSLAWPRSWQLGPETDLVARYNKMMVRSQYDLKLWLGCYVVAFVTSFVAVLIGW